MIMRLMNTDGNIVAGKLCSSLGELETFAARSGFDVIDQYDEQTLIVERSVCGSELTLGAIVPHDPYSTSCDLDPDHAMPHEGPDPFNSEHRMKWTGGGSIEGDPLPYRIVKMKES